jgi:hypothetical protein
VVLRDIVVHGAGTGLWSAADGGGNTNGQRWENIGVFNSRRYGVRIEGTDASGGVFEGIVIQNSRDPRAGHDAVGLLEASANGNVHVGHILEINDIALRVQPLGGLAPSTFVGIYVEEGDPVEWLPNPSTNINYGGNTTTVGGHLVMLPNAGGNRFGGNNSYTTFRNSDSAGNAYAVQLPAGQWQSAMMWRRYDTSGSGNTWLLQSDVAAPANTNRWRFTRYNTAGQAPLSIEATSDGATPPVWTQGGVMLNGQAMCEYGTNQCGW